MLIGVSEMDGKTKEEKDPHLHIVFYACPCATVANVVVKSINDHHRKKGGQERVATRHDCYDGAGYIRYMHRQSRKRRILEHDPDKVLNEFSVKAEVERLDSETSVGWILRLVGNERS